VATDHVGARFYAILFDEMQARELMRTHVVKTTPEASLAEAIDLLDVYQVNSMPVIDAQDRLCGIVAEQDVLRVVRDTYSPIPSKWDGPPNLTVGDIMQSDVTSISEEADVQTAVPLFFKKEFTRIPVTRSDGAVVGTLTRIDILQALYEGRLAGPVE